MSRPLSARLQGSLSAGWTRIHDPTPDGSAELLEDDQGNALVDRGGDGEPDGYASDFGVLDVVAALRTESAGRPLALSVEAIENLGAVDGEGTGWALGLCWGRAARAGDWRVTALAARLEQDAVFSAFAQDDFAHATGMSAWMLGVNHQLSAASGLYLWALVSDPLEGDDEETWRVRLDWNVKF